EENSNKEENEAEKKEENNENGEDEDNHNENEEQEEPDLPKEEVDKINEKIINTRKEAGQLYKEAKYVEALNIYTLLLKDAKRAKLKDQEVILFCNQGICFNKLKQGEKALDSFTNALSINHKYSKALANRMLLYNSKQKYMEALEDFNLLKEVDINLWNNYSHMEYALQANAEVQKKQMTEEMLGKLKDLGNSILGNFGMSLDNFHMTPNGQGGYSIQYDNNKNK
ncbi:MAG: hypothetical protein MJ252_19780, partial [archaeon]|nr:hypothetical protein [archaeon]